VKSTHHDLTPLFYNVSQIRKKTTEEKRLAKEGRKEELAYEN
jgi:hypothetical protein